MFSLYSVSPLVLASILQACITLGSCDVLGLDQGTCFRTTKINVSQTVNLETPVVFYRHNYSKIYISSRAVLAFKSHYTGGYVDNQRSPLNIPYKPFLAPLYTFGTEGEICYWQTKNSSVIEQYASFLSDNEKKDIGLHIFHWSLLIVRWNEITINPIAVRSKNLTFQAALLSDGNRSYSRYTYDSIHEEADFVVGFNAGDDRTNNKFVQLGRFTGTPSKRELDILTSVYRIDGDCITQLTSSCDFSGYAKSCDRHRMLSVYVSTCSCMIGFNNLFNNTCTDIDECINANCEQHCSNTPGSYACYCNTAFELAENGKCRDIDECRVNNNLCHHNCSNTVGSFECICLLGYTLMDDGHSCIDLNECESSSACENDEICVNRFGSYHCYPGCGILETFSNFTCIVSENAIIGFSTGSSIFVLIGMIICMMLVVAVTCRRMNKRKRLLYNIQSPSTPVYPGNPFWHHNNHRHNDHNDSLIELVKVPKKFKVRFKDLDCDSKMLGEGAFGSVHKAKLRGEEVAVKILTGFSGTAEIQIVIDEVLKMKDFSHPNILTLKALAIDQNQTPCIVMPFMWMGSLDVYLRKEENRKSLLVSTEWQLEGHDTAAVKLLEMCLQISKGMAYLSSKKIIHRNLAARNCMMDMKYAIKVADYGLPIKASKPGDEAKQKLSVKWLALESLQDDIFSEASDVWSYGVTCWEVFNGGRKPYPNVMTKELLQELLAGYRMQKPQNQACTDSIYNIMLSCWKRDPLKRPSFSNLVLQTTELLQDMEDFLRMGNLKQQEGMMGVYHDQHFDVYRTSVAEETYKCAVTET